MDRQKGQGKLMNHIKLYNNLRQAIETDDVALSKHYAQKLLHALTYSLAVYGWNRFAKTGNHEVDEVLEKVNRNLTGPEE